MSIMHETCSALIKFNTLIIHSYVVKRKGGQKTKIVRNHIMYSIMKTNDVDRKPDKDSQPHKDLQTQRQEINGLTSVSLSSLVPSFSQQQPSSLSLSLHLSVYLNKTVLKTSDDAIIAPLGHCVIVVCRQLAVSCIEYLVFSPPWLRPS